MQIAVKGLRILRRIGQKAGPYLVLEMLLPGGTLFALLLFLYRHRECGISWGAQRAAVYGVAEEDLGAFYARRTLLGREVLPEHVAAGVFALVGGDLSLTTGLHIPVDAGVAAAFLR